VPDAELDELAEAARVTSAEQILDALTGSFWYRIGYDTAAAYIRRKEWLYRRVESIELVERRCLRRQVNIDFERPDCLPDLVNRAPAGGCLVPVSVFVKWPPLMNLGFRGHDGEPLSMCKRTTNKQLDFGLLNGLADALGVQFDTRLSCNLALLVAINTPSARLVQDVIRDLREALVSVAQPGDPRHEGQIADIANLASQLANSSILWAPVNASSGEDRVVKFSYLDHYTPKRSLRQLLIACSWHDRTRVIPLTHAGQHTSYHADVHAEAGIEFMRVVTRDFPATPPGARMLSRIAEAGGTAAPALTRRLPSAASPFLPGSASGGGPEHLGERQCEARRSTHDDPALSLPLEEAVHGSSVIADRHIHIYHPPSTARSHRVFLLLELAASREGFISHCLVMAVALALVMSVAFAKLQEAAEALPALVVLLAAVPLVLGYLLVRIEDPLEREGTIGVRALAIAAGALPILGGLLLVLANPTFSKHPDLTFVRPAWATLTIVSWVIALGLGWSWSMAASPPRKTPREHRVQNIASISASICALSLVGVGLLDVVPYRHLASVSIAGYLRSHDIGLIAAGSLLVLGASALHGTIGGIRRRIRYGRRRPGDGLAGTLLVVAGGAWIWGTTAAGVLLVWEAMTITRGANTAPLMVPALTVVNATLIPAGIVILSTTTWILARRAELVKDERVLGDPWLALAGLLLAAPPLLLRAIGVLSSHAQCVTPGAAWIGFALWLLCLAALVRDPVKDALGLRPIDVSGAI
jgi:hypothetical protein